jgi:hypothetical protein
MSVTQDLPDQLDTPDRVFYDTGVLLDAEDFRTEQRYHRGRLARALSLLHGSGTVAGLKVDWTPAAPATADTPARDEQLEVAPGLAIDRLGRMIELPRPACMRLRRWLDEQTDDDLTQALYLGADAPVVDITNDDGTTAQLAVEGIVADLFVRFEVCERGKTPAFASGPFDALDAVAPSRLRDGYHLELRLRKQRPLPVPARPTLDDLAALQRAIFEAWDIASARDEHGNLEPLPEHAAGQDNSYVFLARVVIPAAAPAAGERVTPTDGAIVRVANNLRPFIYTAGALARLLVR